MLLLAMIVKIPPYKQCYFISRLKVPGPSQMTVLLFLLLLSLFCHERFNIVFVKIIINNRGYTNHVKNGVSYTSGAYCRSQSDKDGAQADPRPCRALG